MPSERGNQPRPIRASSNHDEERAEPVPNRPRIGIGRSLGTNPFEASMDEVVSGSRGRSGRQGRQGDRIRAPHEDIGSPRGLLFHINHQLRLKRKEFDRVRGELAYFERRKKELEALVAHSGQRVKPKEAIRK